MGKMSSGLLFQTLDLYHGKAGFSAFSIQLLRSPDIGAAAAIAFRPTIRLRRYDAAFS